MSNKRKAIDQTLLFHHFFFCPPPFCFILCAGMVRRAPAPKLEQSTGSRTRVSRERQSIVGFGIMGKQAGCRCMIANRQSEACLFALFVWLRTFRLVNQIYCYITKIKTDMIYNTRWTKHLCLELRSLSWEIYPDASLTNIVVNTPKIQKDPRVFFKTNHKKSNQTSPRQVRISCSPRKQTMAAQN